MHHLRPRDVPVSPLPAPPTRQPAKEGDTAADTVGETDGLNGPVAVVGNGTTLYVADADDDTINKIDIRTGALTPVAGSRSPSSLALSDGTTLFVAQGGDKNHSTIDKVDTTTGQVTTLVNLPSSDTSAGHQWSPPAGLALSNSEDTLFVTDPDTQSVYSVDTRSGKLGTLAGGLSAPKGIAVGGKTLYLSDGTFIRKVNTKTGKVKTVSDEFTDAGGLTLFDGTLYVTDSNSIRQVDTGTGKVSTVAGGLEAGYSEGGEAEFDHPTDLARLGSVLFVADMSNSAIRVVDPSSRRVGTLAIKTLTEEWGNGVGATALFNKPSGLVVASPSTVYVTGGSGALVQKLDTVTGKVTDMAARSLPGGHHQAPAAVKKVGDFLYVSDGHVLYKVDTESWETSLVAGHPAVYRELMNDEGEEDSLVSMAVKDMMMYIADESSDEILAVDLTDSSVSSIPGRFKGVSGLAVSRLGSFLYVSYRARNVITRVTIPSGEEILFAGQEGAGAVKNAWQADFHNGVGGEARFRGPAGLALMDDTLFVADMTNDAVRMINTETRRVRTLWTWSGLGVWGMEKPRALAVSLDKKKLYVACWGKSRHFVSAVNI